MNIFTLYFKRIHLGGLKKLNRNSGFGATWISVVVMISFFLSVMAIPTVLAADKATPTSAKFITYYGTKYGISIQHPENWKLKEDVNGVWLSSPVQETGNFRVDSQPTQNVNLSTLVQIQLQQSKDSYKQMQILSSNLSDIAGLTANRTDYTFRLEVPKLLGVDTYDYRAVQFSMIKGQKLYTVTYFSEPSSFFIFLPIAEKMLSTLKIL